MSNPAPRCPTCSEILQADLCPRCTLHFLAEAEGLLPVESDQGPDIAGLTVHEQLGEGGFGLVYRATQTGVAQRSVALKVLKPGVDTRAVLRRFELEKRALAALEHPNVARFYDAGETSDGYPWFTMEYVEGEPIHTALLNADLDAILRVFEKVCEAVAGAHDQGIIHRDLKPANILVSPLGTPKIIDFGVARAIGPDVEPGATVYTANERLVGTPAYRAPEDAADIDARSDVFGIGITLYEPATGLTPQEGERPLPPASRHALRKIPRALDLIIAKATAPSPRERYQSATDLCQDLRDLRAGRKLSFARASNSWIVPSAVLAACCLLVLLLAPWSSDDPAPSPVRRGAATVCRGPHRCLRHAGLGSM